VPRAAAWIPIAVSVALVAAGCGSSAKTTSGGGGSGTSAAPAAQPTTTTGKGSPVCQSNPHPGGTKAVFGQRSSATAAEALRQKAESRGFKGLDVQEAGCGVFLVTLPGLTGAQQFAQFKAEAKTAGFDVTMRCEAAPSNQTGNEAVFGWRRTHHEAVNLKRVVVHNGFVTALIIEDGCYHWSVVVPGITSDKMARDFAAEARSAGFKVTFRPS